MNINCILTSRIKSTPFPCILTGVVGFCFLDDSHSEGKIEFSVVLICSSLKITDVQCVCVHARAQARAHACMLAHILISYLYLLLMNISSVHLSIYWFDYLIWAFGVHLFVHLFVWLVGCIKFFISIHFQVHLLFLVQGVNFDNDCCRLANGNMQPLSDYCSPAPLLFSMQCFIHILRTVYSCKLPSNCDGWAKVIQTSSSFSNFHLVQWLAWC